MTLKIDMDHRGLNVYKVDINDDPGLTFTYFTGPWQKSHNEKCGTLLFQGTCSISTDKNTMLSSYIYQRETRWQEVKYLATWIHLATDSEVIKYVIKLIFLMHSFYCNRL